MLQLGELFDHVIHLNRDTPVAAGLPRGDTAFVFQCFHGDHPTAALFTHEATRGYAGIGEVRLVKTIFASDFADGMRLDTIDLHGRQEERQAIIFSLGIGVGARQQNHVVSVIPERRPDFGAVNHVIVAVAHGAGLYSTQIRAMIGLGKALAPDLLAREDVFDVFRFLFVGAHVQQQWTNPVQANSVKDNGRVVLRQFLVDDVLIGRVSALPTIFTGPVHAQVPRAPELMLPLAQKIELLFRAHFQKCQW